MPTSSCAATARFLHAVGFAEFAPLVELHDIDLLTFSTLSVQELQAIGVAPIKTAVALEEKGAMISSGGRIGTWSYWAPEQLEQRPYDFAVDMWSLGMMMC